MTNLRFKAAVRVPLWVAGLAIAGTGHTAERSTLDLTASVGVSTNPGLQLNGTSSAFGRISGLGMHEWRSERTTTSISLYGENTTYLNGYGSKQIFSLNGHTSHEVNPNLTIFGNLGFQGDFGGQLSNRFATTTPDLTTPPNDELPPSVILDDPTLNGFSGRQYRLSGQLGLSMRASARSSVSLSAGAQRNFAKGGLSNANYNSYFGNASWDTQFSERLSAGLGVNAQYQDYDNGGTSSVLNPYVSVRHQFSDEIEGRASVGLLLTHQKQPGFGSSNSVDPSFSFSICKANSHERLCARGSRETRSSFGLGTITSSSSLGISTSAGIDYSRQLDANQSVQAAVTATRYSTSGSSVADFRSTYLNFLVGYDRKLRERLSAGANAGARKFFVAGRDPKTDFSATAYVRYRLGDIQ